MHPISDKELDKLFKQRFEDAEFQPSGDVWGKISAKMDRKAKVKKTLPVFWMAAASVVVVVGAGLWFYRPVEVIRLQGTEQVMVESTTASKGVDFGAGALVLDHVHPEIKGFDFTKLASSDELVSSTNQEASLPGKSVEQVSGQEVIASANSSKRNTPEATKPKNEVEVPRYTGDQSQLDVTQPDMIASAEFVEDDLVPEAEQTTSRRIRSVGSLVNFVISKVDRRDDKIIEFIDGDEGSEVSGINLGLIKLKSRNK